MPNLTEKIIRRHLTQGDVVSGEPIAITIDQTLTQDATGTMAYLQLEAMGVEYYRTDLDGNITFTSDGETISVRTEKP